MSEEITANSVTSTAPTAAEETKETSAATTEKAYASE